MTRIGYDSVTLANCPTDGAWYGCYVDGLYENDGEAAHRFPGRRLVKITVLGSTLDAHVADVETGDLTPPSGAAWAKRKTAAGQHPTLYCNASTWPAVKTAVHAAGLDGKVSYWIAHYDGDPTIPAGAVAKQYLGDYHGYDKSNAVAYWPGVDPTPTLWFPGWYRRGHPLRRGVIGWRVLGLKRYLRALGYKGITWASPIYGPGVVTAVRAFQRSHKLTPDGVVGDHTAHALQVARTAL